MGRITPLEVLEAKALKLAKIIDLETPEGWGFALLHFRFDLGDGVKNASYVSNCTRPEMIRALREQADRLEAGDTDELEPFPPDAPVRGL